MKNSILGKILRLDKPFKLKELVRHTVNVQLNEILENGVLKWLGKVPLRNAIIPPFMKKKY